MALTKAQKTAQVADLTDKMKKAQSVIFSHYIGMTVAEVSELRGKLREVDAEMKVGKKTLLKIAAKEAGLPEITDTSIDGPVACIFSFADPLSGAQIAFKFAKTHDQVQLVGGVFDGKILTKEEAVELAKMPSRDELLAKFVGMIQSPLVSFASMCGSPLSGFARALNQLAEKGGLNPQASVETPAENPAPAEEAPKEEATPAEEAPAAEEAPKESEEQKGEEPPSESSEEEKSS